ncbi:hypothetical protein N826_28400 [Skermanella aerolata KACC 11604]|nr:hypothetical protein N826_28400 [Skermanella aerolata KACC 11604]
MHWLGGRESGVGNIRCGDALPEVCAFLPALPEFDDHA